MKPIIIRQTKNSTIIQLERPYSITFKQGKGIRDDAHAFGRAGSDLEILGQTTGVVPPSQGTFDCPSPRKFLPFVGLDLFRDVYGQTKSLSIGDYST